MSITCKKCGKSKSGQGAKDGVCFMCQREGGQSHQKAEVLASNSTPLLCDFPMLDGPNIPWSVAEEIYKVYSGLYGKQQSLKRLAERGGFYWGEVAKMWKGKRT